MKKELIDKLYPDGAKCFLCNKDITYLIKVLSYSQFPEPHKLPTELKDLINGVLCQDCASKDMEVSRYKAKLKLDDTLREVKDENKRLKEGLRYVKFLWFKIPVSLII